MSSTTRMPRSDTDPQHNPDDPQDGRTDDRGPHGADQQPPGQPGTHRLDLSFSQVAGGALAAMTAAAIGSRLGVAGTLVGAALASVCAAVLGSIYTLSIRRTREAARTALHRATPVLRTTRGRQQVPVQPGSGGRRLTLSESDLTPADSPAAAAGSAPLPSASATRTSLLAASGDSAAGGTDGPLARPKVSRRRLLVVAALGSVAIFVITLGAIFGIEAVSGRSLDGQSGGTTLGQVVHGTKKHGSDSSTGSGGSSADSPKPSAGSTAGDQPSSQASGGPGGAASSQPSDQPSAGSTDQPSSQTSAPATDQPSDQASAGTGSGQDQSGSGSSAGTDSGNGSGSGTGNGTGTGSGNGADSGTGTGSGAGNQLTGGQGTDGSGNG